MPDINMLGSLRGRLKELGKATDSLFPGKSRGGTGGPVLGALAAIWLIDKLIVEKAHKAAQETFDRAFDTSGANLNLL